MSWLMVRVLTEVTTQCFRVLQSPSFHVYKSISANLMLRVTLWWTRIPSRGECEYLYSVRSRKPETGNRKPETGNRCNVAQNPGNCIVISQINQPALEQLGPVSFAFYPRAFKTWKLGRKDFTTKHPTFRMKNQTFNRSVSQRSIFISNNQTRDGLTILDSRPTTLTIRPLLNMSISGNKNYYLFLLQGISFDSTNFLSLSRIATYTNIYLQKRRVCMPLIYQPC